MSAQLLWCNADEEIKSVVCKNINKQKKSQLPFSVSLLNTCGVSFKEYKYHLELHEKSYL